jgi:hypothetical protein
MKTVDISSDMAGSGDGSAFFCYTGVDDFVAVCASERIQRHSDCDFLWKASWETQSGTDAKLGVVRM